MKNKIIALSFVIFSVSASVPTTESLFRNNNNSDVEASLVMITVQAQKSLNKKIMNEKASELTDEEKNLIIADKNNIEKINLKYLFSVNDSDNVEVVRIAYRAGALNDKNIIDVKFYKNLRSEVLTTQKRKGVFLALLSSLALNRSEEISSFLKKNSGNYKNNLDLIDPEKRNLYSKYKRYLKIVKKDQDLKDTLENPMNPQDSEIRKIVRKIKNRPFLQKDESVSLEKKETHFFWKVELDVMSALFDGKTQRLLKLNYKELDNDLTVSFDDYILFNGNNELPKIIKMGTSNYLYTLRTSSHAQLNLGTKSMWNRYSEYAEKLKRNEKSEPVDYFFL